jgi:predicted DNA-binding transcriptional regulator AlpA
MKQDYVRMAELSSTKGRQGLLPVSASTIRQWIKAGRFPAPVRLGPRVIAWRLQDIEAFVRNGG